MWLRNRYASRKRGLSPILEAGQIGARRLAYFRKLIGVTD